MWKKTKDENSKPKSPPLGKSPIEQLKEQSVEDLIIQGRVEGKIDLKKNNITVDKSGSIKGDIYGKSITLEGEVEGNLFGERRIVLQPSGVVRGDLRAPAINLEEGAKFKGSIDMEAWDEKQSTLKEVPLAQVQNLSNKT